MVVVVAALGRVSILRHLQPVTVDTVPTASSASWCLFREATRFRVVKCLPFFQKERVAKSVYLVSLRRSVPVPCAMTLAVV